MKPMIAATIASGLLAALVVTSARAEPWPGWRGPRGDGTSLEKNVPTKWDPTNAVWKTEMPGNGHASPIVWGDRVCHRHRPARDARSACCLCLDRATGKILWQQTVVQGPLEKMHKENSYASGTPATDGERVYRRLPRRRRDRRGRARSRHGQAALAGPARHARRRVGLQQRAGALQGQGHRGRRQQGRFVPGRAGPRGRQGTVARQPHPQRHQLQRPADPRDGRPHAVDPVRRPLRDEFRPGHRRTALDRRRPVGGVRRHARLQRKGRTGLRQQQLAQAGSAGHPARRSRQCHPNPRRLARHQGRALRSFHDRRRATTC